MKQRKEALEAQIDFHGWWYRNLVFASSTVDFFMP